MDFDFLTLGLNGVYLLRSIKHTDNCGYKFCSFDSDIFLKNNINFGFKKSNIYYSEFRSLRGIYYEKKSISSFLLSVLSGSIIAVVVDLRHEYGSFCRYVKLEISSDDISFLFIPKGCAYGFLTLSDYSCVEIKSDDSYFSTNLCGLSWDDNMLNIDWGVDYSPMVCNDVTFEKLS